MIPTTVRQIARQLGCPAPESSEASAGWDARVTGMVVDSRLVTTGSLFVALPGERVDGHDYVQQALRDGAVAAVVSRPIEPSADGVCLLVEDPLVALGQVGRLVVTEAKRNGLRVVAITGSQGKTSTKDLLGQVLDRAGPTVAPHGSFNNEIGVPLTAARIEPDTRFLISEMGARGRGHIAYLSRLTPPDVGVVLNVGSAHLGMFGSRQAIAEAKGELVEALAADGIAVLNLTDPHVAAMAGRTIARRFGFLEPDQERAGDVSAELEVSAEQPHVDDAGCWSFSLRFHRPADPGADQRSAVALRLVGRHQIGNALAAATAAYALGLAPEEIAAGLNEAGLRSRWRMEVSTRSDGLTLVNDAYNANPGSMAAALDTLADLGTSRRRNGVAVRTVAVLGDMLELGATSADEHAVVGRRVAELGIDRLFVVGDDADSVVAGALGAGFPKESASMVSSIDELGTALAALTSSSDIILLKASRSIGLEVVADQLLSEEHTPS